MAKFINIIAAKDRDYDQAMIAIDADPDAERVIVMARDTGEVFHNFTYQSNKQLKFIVPLIYSVNADLLVGILDDNRTYNTKFVDGVKAELIDGNTVNIRP
ncbi:hypothetical protein L5M38_02620 [Shewanella sp. SM101]|uniref:hypothetical protein n=1 Tax=unclassified Shewanella TaxID=196818 RepID=UPI0021DB1AD7|nr:MULTISPECIES: hypothetical protein [unclassified Shewanella]MCU8004172.1 hypothetical protein [Shewanella sp. SM96]MCU8103449.1 hypothetical protein [Shewanella sp. SM101]